MQRLFGDMARGEESAAWKVSACEAPGTATSDGITLAVRGQPFWRGGKETPADARLAEEILQAYRQEGLGLLDKLHGSFALAILDAAAGRSLLAIDRMGIGRLAYAAAPDRLVFSSSAEAVARHLSASPPLDRQAIFDYLFLHMVPSPATIFAGVRKLPPASVALFEHGRLDIRRYWNPVFTEDGEADFDSLKERLHASLREAVRCTSPSDSTGAFLSGGLDSSTVAGLLSELVPSPARTFTIGFGFEGYDELDFARIANRRFGCAGHEHSIVAADIVAAFPAIARAYDEPFGNSSALPAYYCAQLAADNGVHHLLAGDGGDELFAGNSRYAKQSRYEDYQRIPEIVRKQIIERCLGIERTPADRGLIGRARSFASRARIPLPDRLEIWNPIRQFALTDVLEPNFLESIDPEASLGHMRDVYRSAPSRITLIRMLCYDWRFTLADNDLRKVEAMCGLSGIQVSYPMLHPDVVELATQVPPGLMMPDARLRDFYKRAMSGFLPDEIIHKQKHGFGLPFGLWLQECAELRSLITGCLDRLRDRGIVRSTFIDRLHTLHGEHDPEYYGVLVWVLAMLEQWFQEHEVQP